MSALEKGVAVSHRAAHRPANKVAAAFTKPVVFKNARRAAKALDAELAASFYRPDLVAAAKARVATLLAAQKERKFFPKKIRANKLAKLTK